MRDYCGTQADADVLPHNLDAECAVLGALMLAPEALAKISDFLAEADFYRDSHKIIFRAITELAKREAPCDAVTLAEWFESNGLGELIGGPSYLIGLASNTPSAANIVAYGEIIAEKSRHRQVISIGRDIVARSYEAREESQIIVANASHEFSLLSAATVRGGLDPAKMAMRKMHAANMRRYENYKKGVTLIGQPWPWEDLNNVTSGMCDETLYIVGARPSMGKTIFGLQAAVFNALRGSRTAFFSVEMSAEQIMGRAVACAGQIPHQWVKQPRDDLDESEVYWSRYAQTINDITESDLLIDETPMLSVRQLLARARRAHMQKPLRLIVVDHMHDMEVDPRNARFDYGIITQAGKSMAKEFGCPVILLAQLSRAAANRKDPRPVMSDLRESGEIEQKADVILFLHRDDYYDPGVRAGIVEVIPAKGRDIEVGGAVLLQNEFARMRMVDYAGTIGDPFAPPPPKGRSDKGLDCDF